MDFKILDENGKVVECEMLYTFTDSNSNINYILYTDNTMDDDGKLEVYASRYELVGDSYVLKAIENDQEWDLVDEVLAEFLKN